MGPRNDSEELFASRSTWALRGNFWVFPENAGSPHHFSHEESTILDEGTLTHSNVEWSHMIAE
jgi:hypothetical protein